MSTPAILPLNRILAWLGALLLAGLVVWLLAPVLTPFVVAAVLAYVLHPLVLRLQGCGRGRLPRTLVGTSAGAAIAAALLTTGPQTALTACKRLYANNTQLFDWKGLSRLRLKFAHQHIYPAWISSLMSDTDFPVLQQTQSRLSVAITQPARFLGLGGSLIAGSVAYLLDKKIAHSIHPKLPRYLGLRQAFLSLNECGSSHEARNLLDRKSVV